MLLILPKRPLHVSATVSFEIISRPVRDVLCYNSVFRHSAASVAMPPAMLAVAAALQGFACFFILHHAADCQSDSRQNHHKYDHGSHKHASFFCKLNLSLTTVIPA